ncbi:MAG: hypothetical protein MUP44_04140 [Anaerolineales bacterium]|nr:hypothetical protein [Anaerolineales bacterium]
MNIPYSLPTLLLYVLVFAVCVWISLVFLFGKRLVPYLWRSLVTSTLGVVIANSIFWAFVLRNQGILKAITDAEPTQGALGVILSIGLLASPLYVSVIGAVTGIVLGVFWARRCLRKDA